MKEYVIWIREKVESGTVDSIIQSSVENDDEAREVALTTAGDTCQVEKIWEVLREVPTPEERKRIDANFKAMSRVTREEIRRQLAAGERVPAHFLVGLDRNKESE